MFESLAKKIAFFLEPAISDKLVKAIGDKNKTEIEEKKLEFEREKFEFTKKESEEKLKLEKEKFLFESNDKLLIEKNKFELDKIHKERSYTYPTDIAAESRKISSKIRGRYAAGTAIFISSLSAAYFYLKKEEIEEKEKLLDERIKLNEERSLLASDFERIKMNAVEETLDKLKIRDKFDSEFDKISADTIAALRKNTSDRKENENELKKNKIAIGILSKIGICSLFITPALHEEVEKRFEEAENNIINSSI